MSIIKTIEKELKDKMLKLGYEVDNVTLAISNRPDLGEYQLNDAFSLAKKYHKNPREIAENIKRELDSDKTFQNVNIAGAGFINISLSNDYLVEALNKINNDIYEDIDKLPKKKVILDYGGANVAKTLHVGHLRSANLGEALKRLGNLLGYEMIGDAHLGDFGRPIGFVMLELKKRYPDLGFFDENYPGDYNDIELPIDEKDLETIYPEASAKAKEDEEYLEEGREMTLNFQKRLPGYYELSKKIVELSKKDIKKMYDLLNVHFELWLGESDAVQYVDELEEIFEKNNALIDSEDAKIIEVKEDTDKAPMPPLIFTRSNGTISYETTDLATILQRKKDYDPDEIWYLVDERQHLHFDQVFRAARKVKLVSDETNLEFIGFGTMNGKDGKPFKTRSGGVMSLKELIKLVNEETLKKITNESLSEEEKKEISQTVAIAALKYADFLPFRGKDYIFEVEKFADLEGKTGPYLLYSTIRMKSLLNKCKDLKQDTLKTISSQSEKDIALTILNLPNILTKSLEVRSLNDIADYLYKLTSQYNKFYSENIIISEQDPIKQESWLVLTNLVYKINMLLLDTLGIKVPEKM